MLKLFNDRCLNDLYISNIEIIGRDSLVTNTINVNEERKSDKIFTFFLILSLIGNVYLIKPFNIGFGEVFIVIGIICAMSLDVFKVRITTNKSGVWVFIIYALAITLFNIIIYPNIDVSETVKRLIRDGFYWITVFVFSKTYFNWNYAYKLLNMLCTLLSILVIVQFVAYLLFGLYIPGLIEGLATDAGGATAYKSKALIDASILGYIRPNGFLSEPAQCAHILSIALFINLMRYKEKGSKYRIILFSIATVCTTSLNGIVLMIFVYVLYYFRDLKNFHRGAKLNTFISLLAVVILMTIAYLRLPFVQSVVHRLTYIGNSTTGSVAMRVLRGPVFYMNMPIFHKIFGIGFGNFIGFREATHIWTAYEEPVEYFCTNAYILISTGIVGFIILLSCILRMMQNMKFIRKGIIAILIVAGFSSSIYSTAFLAVAISFALFGEIREEEQENLEL